MSIPHIDAANWTAGRKRANATYHHATTTDQSTALEFAMNLMPLLEDPKLDPVDFVGTLIARFQAEVQQRLSALVKEIA